MQKSVLFHIKYGIKAQNCEKTMDKSFVLNHVFRSRAGKKAEIFQCFNISVVLYSGTNREWLKKL